MKLYYRYERENSYPFNAQKVKNRNTIKIVTPRKSGSFIAGYKFSTDNIRQAIQDEIDYFTEQRKSFEWKVYGTDDPSFLPTELVSLGFTPDDPEAFMIKELNDSEFDALTLTGTIKQIANEAGVNDVIQVSEQVWGNDFSDLRQDLTDRLHNTPDQISLYVAYENDLPVSSAWITYTPGSPFAGLWGGSTINAARGKGYYRELLYIRAAEARKRGVKYLTVDASDMSRPILEKFDFKYVTETRPYQYSVD